MHNKTMPTKMVVATDYDGTIAESGVISPETVAAMKAFKAKGGLIILVTGRDMQDICGEGRPVMTPYLHLFDCVVAENGAMIWDTQTNTEHPTAPRIPKVWRQQLVAAFPRMFEGHEILSIPTAFQQPVEEFMKRNGIKLQIELNKGSMMLTMPGITKASGLRAAAAWLNIPIADTVGVGDGENDVALLTAAGIGVAVANALPEVKAVADYVMQGSAGAGVRELFQMMINRTLQKGLGFYREIA